MSFNFKDFLNETLQRYVLGYMLPGYIVVVGTNYLLIFGAALFNPKDVEGVTLLASVFLMSQIIDSIHRIFFQDSPAYWGSAVIARELGINAQDKAKGETPKGFASMLRQFFFPATSQKPLVDYPYDKRRTMVSAYLGLENKDEAWWTEWVWSSQARSDITNIIGKVIESEAETSYNSFIAVPDIQSHYLRASSLAFGIVACEWLAYGFYVIYASGAFSPLVFVLAICLFAVAIALGLQGDHKADVMFGHIIDQFYRLRVTKRISEKQNEQAGVEQQLTDEHFWE